MPTAFNEACLQVITPAVEALIIQRDSSGPTVSLVDPDAQVADLKAGSAGVKMPLGPWAGAHARRVEGDLLSFLPVVSTGAECESIQSLDCSVRWEGAKGGVGHIVLAGSKETTISHLVGPQLLLWHLNARRLPVPLIG